MSFRIGLRAALSTTLSVAFLAGCSDSDDNSNTLESSLEIYSWWTSGGESDALDALLAIYSAEYPSVRVTNAASNESTNARERLAERMNSGEPPDSFQTISGVGLLSWVADGKMTSISDLAEKNGWRDVFPAAVLDILSVDGELYGVPANIERDNNLYYNIKVLKDASIEPPISLEDFYSACSDLRENGTTPLAVPAAGWVLALVAFETLMPSVLGGEYYNDFFSGNIDPSAPELRTFFVEFAKVLECSNVSSAESSWSVAADLMYSGDAAMYVMGDWAKGYFEGGKNADDKTVDALEADVDFGVVPGLGSSGYFTFNSAVFGLPAGAQHPRAAREFLEVVGSKQGQEAFNPLKGSVPARSDADPSLFDDMVKGAVSDFQEAAEGNNRLLAGYASLTSFAYQKEVNPALLVFAVGGKRAQSLDPENVSDSEVSIPALDVDYILGKIRVSYPILQK